MAYVRQSGVTYLDPELVHDSFALFTGADSVTRVIDLNGTVVHEWPYAGVPPRILDPALNDGRIGDVGVQLSDSGDARGGNHDAGDDGGAHRSARGDGSARSNRRADPGGQSQHYDSL